MKFKDYLNSLVFKRKNSAPSTTKPQQKVTHTKNHPEPTASASEQYDICTYEDINSSVPEDQHSRTQVLLARHADLVNTIVGTRSPNDNTFSSCTQCRISHQPPPFLPPPLPPKLSLEQQISFSNRNYSSTLATCSPRRECSHQQFPYHQSHFISSQYSTPNPSVVSSSNSSLWTTTTSLSKKQRSRIRTNPWIGNTSGQNRSSAFVDTSCVFHPRISPPVPPVTQPEYGVYDPTYRTSPLGLIHSESFPQTTSNGNIHLINLPDPVPPAPVPTSNVILHQSDSGHGFSLSSSRVIDSSSSSSSSSSSPSSHPSSSSSPDNTSGDGVLSNDKRKHRPKKFKKKTSSTSPPLLLKRSPKQNTKPEKYFCGNTIASDSGSLTRRKKAHRISSPVTLQYRYQRPSEATKTSPVKSPIDRILHEHTHSLSSSSHSIDDHFSLEFEEILENERSHKQRKDKQSSTKILSPTSARKSAFILPLDDTSLKLSSPPPIVFTSTLVKTNSRAILKHIEEIENEIQLIKNLDLADDDDDDDDEFDFSPHAYPEEDLNLAHDNVEENTPSRRQSIYEQVDQWVNTCLKPSNTPNNPSAILPTECDQLTNTIEDYVGCVCPTDDQQTIPSSSSLPEKPITFDLSSISKRTSSFIDEPSKVQPATCHLKSACECPF